MHTDLVMDETTGPVSQARERRVAQFLAELLVEYERATHRYAPLHSAHEAYAVILEELDEFWDEVRKQTESRDPAAMRRELLQVAAMCLRTTVDLGLADDGRAP